MGLHQLKDNHTAMIKLRDGLATLTISLMLVGLLPTQVAIADEAPPAAAKPHLLKPKKHMLHTKLPFEPFCNETLTAIPPNLPLVKKFAEQTAIQSFTYDYKNATDQFEELESCYSKTGWKSFSKAMTASGNLRSAVDDKLFVKATITSDIEVIDVNNFAPRWKILVPLKVRYENETHFVEQILQVKLIIGLEEKKLAVEQIIATPEAAPHPYEKPLNNSAPTS